MNSDTGNAGNIQIINEQHLKLPLITAFMTDCVKSINKCLLKQIIIT